MLTADRTCYVRSDGSDSNTGLANSAGGAFLTLQHAVDVVVGTLDTAGKTITIQIADGSYAAGILVSKGWAGGGTIVVQGNAATPSNVLLSIGASYGFQNTASLPGIFRIKDCKISGTSSGAGIVMTAPGRVEFGNIEFGTLGVSLNVAAPGAYITAIGGFKIVGSQSFPIGIFTCHG
jgi:hypothetical protein